MTDENLNNEEVTPTKPINEEPVVNNEPESGETSENGDKSTTTTESGTSGEETSSDDSENNENDDVTVEEDESIKLTPDSEPEEVRLSYTSIAWVNGDQQIIHVVDLTIGEDNYGSQLIPTQSSIGQTIVKHLTDNNIIIPIESENLEDETELSDERLFVIVQENIQAYIDNFAHTRDYDNAVYCISYKDSIIPRFKNEAKRMMVYRDLCWAIANDFNAKYKSGERERPTLEEIMNALPVLSWEGPIIGLDGEEIDLDAL